MKFKPVKAIRLLQPQVVTAVEKFRRENGGKTASRVAERLILERLAQLERPRTAQPRATLST